ncbi:hypothetical protein GCM10010394_59360 [Streptomyces crystallinus]|uniref:Uncharacterized protein n=1 Tax=Streptomyces crystallinus TaxID=68191 RepID=A0ABN1GVJ0_9ACTN
MVGCAREARLLSAAEWWVARAVPRAPNPSFVCRPWPLLAQFPAPLNPLSSAGRGRLIAQFPAPLKACG